MTNDLSSLKQRIQELEGVHRLAQSLGSVVGVYETLEGIVECFLDLCKAERAAVVLVGESAGDAVQTVVRSTRKSSGEIDHGVNTVVAGWLEVHKMPLLVEDVVKDLKIRSSREEVLILGPALAVPLLSGERMIGFVNLVNSKGGRKFSDDEVLKANVLAPLAAQFVLRARLHETLFRDNIRLKETLQQERGISALLGKSQAMEEVRNTINLVAVTNATVLLVGETGTGKEVAAKAIHYQSPRAERPFVAVNCSAIPSTLFESELFGHEKGAFTGATATMKGKFELADGGTLFLDEISAMPLELQPKLLRILEERSFCRVGSSVDHRVDVRVIAATNNDLRNAIRKGQFREDLFHRLNVVPITLPQLNKRIEDIPLLADKFLNELSSSAKHFTNEAHRYLSELIWKGNVRELRNTVERISILISSAEITAEQLRTVGIGILPASSTLRLSERLLEELHELLSLNSSGKDLFELMEKELIHLSLKSTHGNITQASRLLGIDRNAVQRRIEKYGLE
ncbi:MAG: sigma 54-interacting transcriptional regulator [bacterium]